MYATTPDSILVTSVFFYILYPWKKLYRKSRAITKNGKKFRTEGEAELRKGEWTKDHWKNVPPHLILYGNNDSVPAKDTLFTSGTEVSSLA